MTIGTLTQAFTTVTWGGETLHAYDVGGDLENLAQGVSISLSKSSAAPTAEFSITPTPAGMAVFQKLKSSALDQPFVITFGYLNGSTVGPWGFRFSGVSLDSGHSPRLGIKGVSNVKGPWTDNKISYTLEEEMPLSEFPDFLKEKCGSGCKDLNFVWAGKAKQVAPTIMVTGNQIARPPMMILTDTLRPHGIQVQVGDSAFQSEIVLSYPPTLEGELEVDKPTVNSASAQAQSAQRTVFVVGPGLMTNISRTQTFNTGSNSTDNAASPESPNVPQVLQSPVPEPQNALPQTTIAESTNESGGTSGQANPGSSNTGSTKVGEDDAAMAALSKMITTKVSFNVVMVPYMVGIKPRDLIAIPSLKGPGSYIEDWEVTSVQYTMGNTGLITISISGERPYTGEESLLDSGSLSAVKSTVSGLTTPEAWNKFYWLQGPDGELPLSA